MKKEDELYREDPVLFFLIFAHRLLSFFGHHPVGLLILFGSLYGVLFGGDYLRTLGVPGAWVITVQIIGYIAFMAAGCAVLRLAVRLHESYATAKKKAR